MIAVSDREQSNRFYRDVHGAEVVERHGGGTAYRFGDQQLNVHGPGTAAAASSLAAPSSPGTATSAWLISYEG